MRSSSATGERPRPAGEDQKLEDEAHHARHGVSARKPVYELVDPMGRVFDMQSYSVQKTAQTEADLPTLGSRLTPPQGWTFRSRTLSSDLLVTAVNKLATVVQDDFASTYQLSQQ